MHPWRAEAAGLLRLAMPVALIQLGMMAMGVVDAMMVGRVSQVDLAAVQIGHSWSFFWMASGMGILMVLDPVIAQAVGARDEAAIGRGIQRGLLLAAALSLPIALAVWPAPAALRLLDQTDEVRPVAAAYARATIPSVPFFLVFVVLRQSLQAMHRIRPVLATIVLANVLNVFLNQLLIFGELPFLGRVREPLGAVGSAWSTSACRAAMALALLAWSWPLVRPYLARRFAGTLDPRAFGRMLALGVPVGMQVSAEVGAFCLLSMLAGSLGALAAAGHTIVLNLASAAFMVPLGVAAAAAVRVGHAVGRGEPEGVRRAASVALVAGGGFMALSAGLFVLLPGTLARLYTPDREVIALAVALLPLAALFQVSDGVQVVATGVLRGAGDTRVPMLIHLAGFWLAGIPAGWWLGVSGGRADVRGLWWGLVLGLTVVALILLVRVRRVLARAPVRLDLEGRRKERPAPGWSDPRADEAAPGGGPR